MKVTLGELRRIIVEAVVDAATPRDEAERKLYAAKEDKQASAMVLSALDRRFQSPSTKPVLQTLARAVSEWQAGRGRYDAVTAQLDKLFAHEAPPARAMSTPPVRDHASHTRLKAVRSNVA